ncbi:Uncharacterized protein DAT39_003251, partial [Clarias magur]
MDTGCPQEDEKDKLTGQESDCQMAGESPAQGQRRSTCCLCTSAVRSKSSLNRLVQTQAQPPHSG